MKLHLRDLKSAADGVIDQDPLDMIQRSLERMGPVEEDILIDWVRPAHMDDESGNPDPVVANTAATEGIDVDRVIREEVGTENEPQNQGSQNPRRGGTDDDDDDHGGDGGDGGSGGMYVSNQPHYHTPASGSGGGYQGGQTSYRPWTIEEGFTHATQDTDHGAREAGHGYQGGTTGRQRGMFGWDGSSSMSISTDDAVDQMSSSFGGLSLTPDGSVSSYSSGYPPYHPPPAGMYPYDPSYGQNAASGSDWWFGYPPPPTISIVVPPPAPLMVQTTFCEKRKYPILSPYVGVNQYNYDMHINNYKRHRKSVETWAEYCANQDVQQFIFPLLQNPY